MNIKTSSRILILLLWATRDSQTNSSSFTTDHSDMQTSCLSLFSFSNYFGSQFSSSFSLLYCNIRHRVRCSDALSNNVFCYSVTNLLFSLFFSLFPFHINDPFTRSLLLITCLPTDCELLPFISSSSFPYLIFDSSSSKTHNKSFLAQRIFRD